MDFTAFSHGQIQSKLWLCETIEPFLKRKADIAILGSWYNTLAFMLMIRRPKFYASIIGIDIDPSAVNIANKICDAWRFDDREIVTNIQKDVKDYDLSRHDAIISCSVEHMHPGWFGQINKGQLVCLQSSDVSSEMESWNIIDHTPDLDSFIQKYQMDEIFFAGEKAIEYDGWGYKRFMLIGIR